MATMASEEAVDEVVNVDDPENEHTEEVDEVKEEVPDANDNLPQINILCVGDSLTWGYNKNGFLQYPYADTLNEMLAAQFGYKATFHVLESGVSGELVTETMVDRIAEILDKKTFDIVIHLGGTNDIGYKVSESELIKSLSRIYEMVAQCKAQCIPITVPPTLNPSNEEARNKVNQFILKQNNTVNLYGYIAALSKNERKAFFDFDGLHFSKSGYEQLGVQVYKTVKPLVDSIITK